MGGRVGIVGAGSVRTKPGSITNPGREEKSIAAKYGTFHFCLFLFVFYLSVLFVFIYLFFVLCFLFYRMSPRSLQFILAEELEHEKRVLEDLKIAVQAHLTQLHTEEIILNGMLDFSIEGVVVPKLPIREEVVMCGMGFGENEEGREYGSVGEGIDVEFQAAVDVDIQEVEEERVEEDWARELEWEEEKKEGEDGVNGNFVSFGFNYWFFLFKYVGSVKQSLV